MGKITFVIGGARSGKSNHAAELVKSGKFKRIAFIATGQALDDEMKQRIAHHKKTRPVGWRTFEEPCDVARLVKKIGGRYELILLDCLTLLVSNLVMKKLSGKDIEREAKNIAFELKKAKADSVVVSNEVGLGIVPDNKLGRDFRDVAGRVNQIVASAADEAIFTVAGMPWRIK